MTTLIAAFVALKVLTGGTKLYNKAVAVSNALKEMQTNNLKLNTLQQ
jgi:Flp pilus assembly pilin Flp